MVRITKPKKETHRKITGKRWETRLVVVLGKCSKEGSILHVDSEDGYKNIHKMATHNTEGIHGVDHESKLAHVTRGSVEGTSDDIVSSSVSW
jgi:Ni,Fe-hydrogenase III small subunit